ncbi:MAG: hypothetical protein JNM46_09925, partial [Anaerolineales bacterium]|nr:hypothetical protein [Anaerolineales bacterium]
MLTTLLFIGFGLSLLLAFLFFRAGTNSLQKERAVVNYQIRRGYRGKTINSFLFSFISLVTSGALFYFGYNNLSATPASPNVPLATPTLIPTVEIKTNTPVSLSTPTLPSSETPTPPITLTPSLTPTPVTVIVDIYFTNKTNLENNQAPFSQPVKREVISSDPIKAALEIYFTGPTAQEKSRGLEATWNGFLGFKSYEISSDGILRLYLIGYCSALDTGYNLSEPLNKTLRQFDSVKYVKIYDEYGRTQNPNGASDSIPSCLIPTPTSTPTYTLTSSVTPSRTPLNTATLTNTPTPTHTLRSSLTPSKTPTKTNTPSKTATLTPTFTATSSNTPTVTATPSRTFTPSNTPTTTNTYTPTPTPTLTPTATVTPSRT